MRRGKRRGAHGVSGLNPNFEMAALEGLYSELHFGAWVAIGVEEEKTLRMEMAEASEPPRDRRECTMEQHNFTSPISPN